MSRVIFSSFFFLGGGGALHDLEFLENLIKKLLNLLYQTIF